MSKGIVLRENIQTVKARSLRFAYLAKGSGPLVLCLHGYPDTAYSWITTLNFLADSGFRAVAPFMRGYYPSDVPSGGDYAVQQLALDVLALITALGEEEAILIGHDWGALAAYSAAALEPEKIKKLVTLDMIHPAAISFTPKTLWNGRHIIAYQFRKAAIKRVKQDDFAHIDEIYRRWSPDWDIEGQTTDVKHALAQHGRVEAALGYYWSFADEAVGRDEKSKKGRALARAKTTVPTLTIFGDWGALSEAQMARSKKAFLGPYKYVFLKGVGHFLHREAPDVFFRHLSTFLET